MENNDIINIFFISDKHGMKYMEETEKEYVYYVGLPDLTKKDLEIKQFIEENMVSVLVNLKKDSIFVDRKYIMVTEPIQNINEHEEIKITMSKGVLSISFPKIDFKLQY